MRKTWIVVIAIVVALFAAGYFASPYLAARTFVAAAKSGEADKLEASIDFSAVRASLKPQLMAAVTTRLRNDPSMHGNPFAGLGEILMPSILNRMIDSVVTADGIAALARAGKIVRPGDRAGTAAQPPRYDMHYQSLNRFEVSVRRGDAHGDPTNLVFERRGLFSWKLVRIDLPQDALTAPDLPSDLPPPPPGDDTPDGATPDGAPTDGGLNTTA